MSRRVLGCTCTVFLVCWSWAFRCAGCDLLHVNDKLKYVRLKRLSKGLLDALFSGGRQLLRESLRVSVSVLSVESGLGHVFAILFQPLLVVWMPLGLTGSVVFVLLITVVGI